eukprot:scaffold576_cov180-Skeletonema_dohrnii-CCMP3373.AAC.9
MLCGKKELGDDCLDNPGSCLCGEERCGAFSECEACRRNAPCCVEECEDEGGNGTTDLKSGFCPKHRRLAWNIYAESRRDVQSCRRCERDLLHLRNSAHGASKDICTLSPCANKCVFQDDNGNWCNNDREIASGGTHCYCRTHYLYITKERNQKKKDATYKSTRWTKEEEKVLTLLMQKHKTKGGSNDGCVDWDVVFQEYNAHQEYDDRTKNQMKNKAKGIQKGKKKG